MKSLMLLLALLAWFYSFNTFGDEIPTITKHQADSLRRELKKYERGELTFEQLTDVGEQRSRDLVAFFLVYTNEITVKMKLPIARSYAFHGNFPMAAKLATDYLNVYSNDWRGWNVLGGSKAKMRLPEEALAAMTNIVRLGSDANIATGGAMALQTEQLDVFAHVYYDRLLVAKDAKTTDADDRLDIIKTLVIYSLKAKKHEVFVKALKDIKAEELVKHDDLRGVIQDGCMIFSAPETDTLCRKLSERN